MSSGDDTKDNIDPTAGTGDSGPDASAAETPSAPAPPPIPAAAAGGGGDGGSADAVAGGGEAGPPTSEVEILSTHLAAESAANEKSAKMGTIMFAILAVFVFGYFMLLKSLMKEVVQERNLAQTIVHAAESQLPVITKTVEESIAGALPQMVSSTIGGVVDDSVPQLRKYSQTYLEKFGTQLGDFAGQIGDEVFVDIVAKERKNIKENMPEGLETDKRKLVAHLKGAVTTQMRDGLDQRMEQHLASAKDKPGSGDESAAVKLHKSQTSLNNINKRLTKLAAAKDLSRKDQVTKRIVGAWWGWLRKSQTANASDEAPTIHEDGAGGDGPPRGSD